MANQDDNKPGSKPTDKPSRSAPNRKPVTIEGEAKSVGKAGAKTTDTRKPDSKPAAKSSTVPQTKTAKTSGATGTDSATAKDTKPAASGAPLGRAGADAKTKPSAKQSSAPAEKKPAEKSSGSDKSGGGKSGGGMGSGLLGGLAGGALVALLAGGWGLVSGGADGAGVEDLRAENTALVERISQLEAVQADMGDADPDAELVERVNALTAQLDALSADGAAAPDVDLAPINDRLDGLETQLANAQSSAQSAAETASALQSQVESGGSGDAPALAAQSARLDDLSASVETLGAQLSELAVTATQAVQADPVDLSPVTAQLDALSGSLSEAQASMQGLSGSVSENSSALGDVQTQLSDVQASVAALSSAMDDAQSSIAARDDEQQVARAALAAATLAATIDGGKPFGAELDNFAAVTAGSDSLTSGAQAAEILRPFADSGVPTLATLQAQWPPVAEGILDALRPAPEGMGDKFVSNLRGLVSVRPAGDVGGDGPRAIVGRMTAALDEGQLSRFQSVYAELPEAGQAAASVFAGRVAARSEANSLLTSVLAGDTNNEPSEGETQ